MTPEISTFAAIRYGFGFKPDQRPPSGAEELLLKLGQADSIARALPHKTFAAQIRDERIFAKIRRAVKRGEDGAVAAMEKSRKVSRREFRAEFLIDVVRPVVSPDSFRERLVRFWADHFTVIANGKGLKQLTVPYVEEAIRPHVTGNFRDLLRSAVTHPAMLVFLDQILSVGPNSPKGLQKGSGLNENLAREVLELHTLGVGGAYGQGDVREFAELLTGLQYNRRNGFRFQPKMAEPGAETILGRSYGGAEPSLDDIFEALDDLADHPDTARHLARKLVVHFVSDNPEPALVEHVMQAFTASGGNLMAMYTALLEHPKAWQNFGSKIKQPFDFIISAVRALDIPTKTLLNLGGRQARLYLISPLQVMGQPYHSPAGPDGWPEAAEDWVTPQGMAARIQWALLTTQAYGRELDPQEFAKATLADASSALLNQAVGAAESRLEGMALVLASPEFNRR